MMNVIHQSKYFVVSHHEAQRMFHYVFNAATAHMTSTEYIDELKIFIDLIKQHKPIRVLGNMLDFGFPITPDIQEWVDENLFTVYEEIGFKKIAILLSSEFIAALSIEQTMETEHAQSFRTLFFDDEDKAMQWLLED